MKYFSPLALLVFLFQSLTWSVYASNDAPSVKGWPAGITTMGSIAEGSQNTFSYQHLLSRSLPGKTEAIFTYALGGGGDTYSLRVHAKPTKSQNLIKLARLLEAKGDNVSIMPVVVVYTSGASSSTDAMNTDFGLSTKPEYAKNLQHRLANLIIIANYLQSQKDDTHPIPATLIINPDFLGEIHKIAKGVEWAPFNLKTMKLKLRTAIVRAYKDANVPVPTDIPAEFTNQAGINAYMDAIGWIIKTQAPDVPFGWMDNIWAGDPQGHKWIHHPDQLVAHVDAEAKFLEGLHLYDLNNPWRPDFIAFDKYERDNLGAIPNNLNNGYTYNIPAWNTYFNFIAGVSQKLTNIPVLLFQLPGGHIQILSDIDARADHGSTAPVYLFGDKALEENLTNVKPYITKLTFANPKVDYNFNASKVVSYLKEGDANWQQGHLDVLKKSNIFGILWGGGSTTSIVGLDAARDDSGWLYNRVKAYYQSVQ